MSGFTYHPWTEVVTVMGSIDDLREQDGGSESKLVKELGRAVAKLGGGA